MESLSLLIVFLVVVIGGVLFVPREGFTRFGSQFASVGCAGKKCGRDEVKITYGNRDTPIVYCLKNGEYADTTWAWTLGDQFDCTIEAPVHKRIETYQFKDFQNLGFGMVGPQSRTIRCFRNANSIKVMNK